MNSKNFITKIPLWAIIIALVALLGIAYAVSRGAPQGADLAAAQNQTMQGLQNGMHGASPASSAGALNALVGKPMPEIRLTDKDGKAYTTADLKGKDTVLFFTEGLMCYPACWDQMAAFGSDARFNSDSVQAISVVVDPASEWQKAVAQMPALGKARTLFDANGAVSRELGTLSMPSSMHPGQLPGHTYLLIDKSGVVRFVYDDPNMGLGNDLLYGQIQALSE